MDITDNFGLDIGETIVTISVQNYTSSAITSEGRLFVWGSNYYGQLGDGTTTNQTMPLEITSEFGLDIGEKIDCVSLGNYFSSAITSTGRVFTWGSNSSGQLGDGTSIEKYTPTEITNNFGLASGETVSVVNLGGNHSSAITSTGRVFTWGSNSWGQVGDSTSSSRNTPVDITGNFGLVSGEIVTNVSLGYYHSSALTSNGRILTWGYNAKGQLGDGATSNVNYPTDITSNFELNTGDSIVSISMGYAHSSVKTSDGRIYLWGYNGYGQLGDGTWTNRYLPEEANLLIVYSDDAFIYAISNQLNYNVFDYSINLQILVDFPEDIIGAVINGQYTVMDSYHDDIAEFKLTDSTVTYGDNFNVDVTQLVYTGDIYVDTSGYNELLSLIVDNEAPTFEITDQTIEAGAYQTVESFITNIVENSDDDLIYSVPGVQMDYDTQGVYTITVRLTDQSGNYSDEDVTITVEDTQVPTFEIINQTIEAGAYTTLEPLFTNVIDNSDDVLIYSESGVQMDYDTPGTYTVTVRLTDDSDNFSEEDVTIIVEDNIAPTFEIFDQTIEADDQICYIDWTTYMTSLTDNSDGVLTSTEALNYIPYDTPGTYLATVMLTDESLNETSHTIVVTIIDTTAPTFEIADQTIEAGLYTSLRSLITNIVDNSNTIFYNSNCSEPGVQMDYDTVGVYTVTVRLTDDSGNYSDEVVTITVEDTTSPTFVSCEVTIEAGEYTKINWETYATNVSDNSDGVLTYFEVEDNVDYNTPGTYGATIKLVDESLNETSRAFMVIVIDTQAPTFEIVDQTIEAGVADINWTIYITNQLDNSDGILTSFEIEDNVDYNNLGTYTVTVKLVDESLNETSQTINVTVEDNTAPTFDVILEQTIECGGLNIDWTTYITNSSDNYSTEFSYIEFEDLIDYDTPGTYTVTVKVLDELLNEASQTFNVIVEDTIAPTFEILDQTIEAGIDDIDWTTYITNQLDNSDGLLTSLEVEDNVDYSTPGTYTVIVKLTDATTNETIQTFNVTIEDTTAPTFTIIDETIEVGIADIDWTTYITNQIDNSDGILTSLEVEDNVNYNTPGTYTVIVKLTDAASNETSKTINVTVEDTISPEVVLNPSLDSLDVGSLYTEYGVTSVDITETLVSIDGTVDTSTPGVYVLTYNVSDTSSNTTIIKRYVTVYGKEPIVEFTLGQANTTIKVNEQYTDSTCTVTIDGIEYQCTIKENNLDTSYPGIYTITYAYTYNEIEYTYQRYVFVVDGEGLLLLYLPAGKEGDVEL